MQTMSQDQKETLRDCFEGCMSFKYVVEIDEVERFLESLGPIAKTLDRDRLALERLGVW